MSVENTYQAVERLLAASQGRPMQDGSRKYHERDVQVLTLPGGTVVGVEYLASVRIFDLTGAAEVAK